MTGPVARPGAINPSSSPIATICTGITYPTGNYILGAGLITEDYYGNLYWCAGGGAATHIASPPPNTPSGPAFQFMGGVKTGVGVVLALDNTLGQGMWLCIGATSSGCSVQSTYITFSPTFCATTSLGGCFPEGIALDKNLNVYFADYGNFAVEECTYASAYQSCSVSQALTGSGNAVGLYRDSSGNTWVSDNTCAGNVWKNGAIIATLGEQAWTITVSTANPSKHNHVYVGESGLCLGGNSGVYDVTDGKALPTPIYGPNDDIFGLTTKLQFSALFAGTVYSTKDKV